MRYWDNAVEYGGRKREIDRDRQKYSKRRKMLYDMLILFLVMLYRI